MIHITNPTRYLLLPIEEESAESQVRLNTGDAADTDMDIRLAQNKVDYFVPFSLLANAKTGRNLSVLVVSNVSDSLISFQQRPDALGTSGSCHCP